MLIFHFYLVCFTFSISYSVLPFHLVYILQFLCLFSLSLFMFSQAFIKFNRTAFVCVWVYASLVAQLAKNPPEMQATPVWVFGQDDPLEKG